MKYAVRPLSDRTWLRPAHQRQWSRFESPWSATLTLLGREVDALHGKNVVIELDVPERAIRNDGMLRADAKSPSPAVVVAFDSEHGPVQYRSDLYVARWVSKQGDDWQQNVRAVALTLEALRAVSRYGAADTGQQYAGFKALGAGRAMPGGTTVEAARNLLLALSGYAAQDDWQGWGDPHAEAKVYRAARSAAHPDRPTGSRDLWDQVEQAAQALGVAR